MNNNDITKQKSNASTHSSNLFNPYSKLFKRSWHGHKRNTSLEYLKFLDNLKFLSELPYKIFFSLRHYSITIIYMETIIRHDVQCLVQYLRSFLSLCYEKMKEKISKALILCLYNFIILQYHIHPCIYFTFLSIINNSNISYYSG